VLIVEDDREWRDAAQVLLTDAGAYVRVAESAAAARQVLATFQPDLFVSTSPCRPEDGYSLMQSLRRAGATFPAIALTALARREDAERARQAGFQVTWPSRWIRCAWSTCWPRWRRPRIVEEKRDR
jgi:DNA-binding response OmpR family regulator